MIEETTTYFQTTAEYFSSKINISIQTKFIYTNNALLSTYINISIPQFQNLSLFLLVLFEKSTLLFSIILHSVTLHFFEKYTHKDKTSFSIYVLILFVWQ